jgi:hypothetical protein
VKVTVSALADKLLALLRGYPLEQEAALSENKEFQPSEPLAAAALPGIILSESFVV